MSSMLGALCGGFLCPLCASVAGASGYRLGGLLNPEMGCVLGALGVACAAIVGPRLTFGCLKPWRPTLLWFFGCWIVAIIGVWWLIEHSARRAFPWVLVATPIGVFQGAICIPITGIRGRSDENGTEPGIVIIAIVSSLIAIVARVFGAMGLATVISGMVSGALIGIAVGGCISAISWDEMTRLFGWPYFYMFVVSAAASLGGMKTGWEVWCGYRRNAFLPNAAEHHAAGFQFRGDGTDVDQE